MTHEEKHQMRIHIDRKPYESPNPTTGEALYALGHIPSGKELFREVEGNQEDLLIPRHEGEIHLTKDEHFYSERVFEIFVNTEKKEVETRVLTFWDIVGLAFPNPDGSAFDYTVTYKKALGPKPEGSLVDGGTVRIKNGTIINVSRTNKS
jgi:energy-coupling factor transporter ATP-binding protein EcfA2